ncbi:MAG: ABC transporter ATP-binding protein [Oscillospiraceae bacterium]|nr:ABC transporter ATP-binding protein [Oscillospiraceae bacterium]
MLMMKNIHKTYHAGKPNAFEALKGIDLEIEEGEMVAIIGKSGAGKSTLLHVIACIDSFECGTYQIGKLSVDSMNEHNLAEIRNELIGLVMQDFALIEDFTALDNILLPLEFASPKKKNRRDLARNALQEVGLTECANKRVSYLSGGQKQRVAIARAIINDPAVILADEPTGALDSKTAQEIMDLLKSMNHRGKTIIIVTHDMEIARQCDRMIEIVDGQLRNA